MASHQGTYVLRFEGDVRLTLCVAFDGYLRNIFGDPDFQAVVVDLCNAKGIDSTSLGLLAKLAKESQSHTDKAPLLACDNNDIRRSLESVGIDHLFEPAASIPSEAVSLGTLNETDASEAETREQVLAAHRELMALNPENAAAFKDLVAKLEAI